MKHPSHTRGVFHIRFLRREDENRSGTPVAEGQPRVAREASGVGRWGTEGFPKWGPGCRERFEERSDGVLVAEPAWRRRTQKCAFSFVGKGVLSIFICRGNRKEAFFGV